MRKTTVLVYVNPSDPDEGHRIASTEEWDQILKSNRGLPAEQRRRFILDRIVENPNIDDLFIESSLKEYREWQSKYKAQKRNLEYAKQYSFFSMDVPHAREISASEQVEEDSVINQVLSTVLLSELELVLDAWRPWAVELLHLRMSDQRVHASHLLSEKYGVSQRLYQIRIQEMESFIQDFFEI